MEGLVKSIIRNKFDHETMEIEVKGFDLTARRLMQTELKN